MFQYDLLIMYYYYFILIKCKLFKVIDINFMAFTLNLSKIIIVPQLPYTFLLPYSIIYIVQCQKTKTEKELMSSQITVYITTQCSTGPRSNGAASLDSFQTLLQPSTYEKKEGLVCQGRVQSYFNYISLMPQVSPKYKPNCKHHTHSSSINPHLLFILGVAYSDHTSYLYQCSTSNNKNLGIYGAGKEQKI